jgi:hypothetical protein
MASLGEALVSRVLGHSAAEKAFRPWWDNLEDFLIYGLVMLGKKYLSCKLFLNYLANSLDTTPAPPCKIFGYYTCKLL